MGPRGSRSPLGHGACFSDPPLCCQALILCEPLFFQSNWIACCSQNSPAVSPSRFWFQAFVSVWNVLSPICSNHSSSRSLPSCQLHQEASSRGLLSACPSPPPPHLRPTSRSVTARVCPGSSPQPGCGCRKGPSVASSCPACPWSWGRLAWRGCTHFLYATEVVPVPRQGGQSHRSTLSAQAPLLLVPWPGRSIF